MGAMRLSDLVTDIEGLEVRPGPDPAWAEAAVNGLTADSRDVEPGFVFAAIPGTRADGARFVPEALRRGAAAVLLTPDAANEVEPNTVEGRTPLLVTQFPRAALAHLAARLYADQPRVLCAVTGTNGKTSVASFLRQIWTRAGHRTATLGTLGLVTDEGTAPLGHTTPDPVTLHKALNRLAQAGITHCAMEASSHGLAQHRLDGVRLAAGAFTNLSRDHLDYHQDYADYLAAKLRLFTHVVADGGTAVLNADAECYGPAHEAASRRGLKIVSVGIKGETLRLLRADPAPEGIEIQFTYDGETRACALPLVGTFQASNALMAAGLALATGTDPATVFGALEHLEGADGRMDRVAALPGGAAVFVDYAHTPDALATALKSLRPHTEGKLHVVFGAGGDRDRGKRAEMGRAAAAHADVVIVTDDNPRNEDPAAIRAEILAEVPGAREAAGRRAAIALALAGLGPGDVLLVAGKGHESGQTVKGETYPFKDADVIRELMKEGAQA